MKDRLIVESGAPAQVIRSLAAEDVTMIVVTHEVGFTQQVATEVHVMHNGTIVESASPAQVIHAPRHERTRAFLARMHSRVAPAYGAGEASW